MPRKYTPFTTSIWQHELDIDKNAHKQIIKYVYDLKRKDKGVQISNQGGWQSHSTNQVDPALRLLFEKMAFVSKGVMVDLGLQDYVLTLGNFWFNINGKNNYNNAHIHTGSSLSGVVYLKMPENGGRIRFDRCDSQMWALPSAVDFSKNGTSERCTTIPIQPKELDYVIFPSSLQHGVEPNLSNEDRISMAINFNLGIDNAGSS